MGAHEDAEKARSYLRPPNRVPGRIARKLKSGRVPGPGLDHTFFDSLLPTDQERLELEPEQAFESYRQWVRLGPRRTETRIKKWLEGRRVKTTLDEIRKWRAVYRWDERFNAWEEKAMETLRERERWAKQLMVEHGIQILDDFRELWKRVRKAARGEIKDITLTQVKELGTEIVKMERLILGAPTEIVQQTMDPEMVTALREFKAKYGTLSVEEKERRRDELAARAASNSCGGVGAAASRGGSSDSAESGSDNDPPLREARVIH